MLENLLQEAAQAKGAGDYQQAVLLYEQAMQLCQNEKNKTDQMALCLQELAGIYSEIGLYEQAIPIYQKLIGLGSKILGENHPDVINTAIHLARALEANKQFAQADDIYKLAANRAEMTLGISNPIAQEIREEYFNVLSNRDTAQEDNFKLGLIPLPAGKSSAGEQAQSDNMPAISPLSKTATVKVEAGIPVKKFSSLKQSKKIRKLRYGAESAEEKASNLLNIHVLRYRWRTVFYACSVILGITAIVIALSKLIQPVHVSSGNLIAEQLIEKGSFQSVDSVSGINFIDNKFALLTADVHQHKIPYFLLQGNLSDIWATAMSTIIPKESWYQFKGDELIGEDGSVLYSNGSPEFLLARKIAALADFAQRYYSSHGCYPDKIDKLKTEPGLTYINPFNNKAETPTIKRVNASFGRDSIFPGLKAEATVDTCCSFLQQGNSWQEEPSAGKISALALYSSQRCADGYKVGEFYIHGYDRHAKLITAGKPYTYYVFGLLDGKSLSIENVDRTKQIEQVSVHPPRRIYILPGDSNDLLFMHQCGDNLLTGLTFVGLASWLFWRLRKGMSQSHIIVQPVDFGMLFILIVWSISFIIHLLG